MPDDWNQALIAPGIALASCTPRLDSRSVIGCWKRTSTPLGADESTALSSWQRLTVEERLISDACVVLDGWLTVAISSVCSVALRT